MKACKLSDIKQNVRLARAIMTDDYRELLAAGSIIKPDYVGKLIELGITEVYIEEDTKFHEKIQILKEDVEDRFKEKVKSVIERHVHTNNSELKELSQTADSIISNILEDEEIVEKIFEIRERSADLYEHSISVCSMATIVAAKLKQSKEEMHNLAVACIFHDIGLRYLDFPYTEKMLEDFSEKEQREYKKHPAYGFSALEKEKWISEESKLMILQHHECIDGSGYPLHAKNLSLGSRILGATDAFDEMLCGIGCERAHVYQAVEFLKVFNGTKFSEDVVNTLLDFVAVYPSGTIVELSTGEIAEVIKQNKQFPERPVLKIIKDKYGNDVTNEQICDLLKVMTVYIENVVM